MKYFGTDGIRGVWGEEINIELVHKFANALARYKSDTNHILIGHDTRRSCGEILRELETVFSSYGIKTTVIGRVPTTALAFLTRKLGCDMGLMITASHNPPSHNGIKIFNNFGEKLPKESVAIIDSLINSTDAVDHWVNYLVEKFEGKIDTGGLKIAADFANGSGADVAKAVFARLGVACDTYNTNTGGDDINVGCGAVNHAYLRDLFQKNPDKYDLGFAFDGDADRLVVFDRFGRAVSGDALLAVLARHQNAKSVITTVMFNGGAARWLEKCGMNVSRTAVGDMHILAELKRINGDIGGEPSGHYIFPKIILTDDGLVSALMVLCMLAKTRKSIHEIISAVPLWHSKLLNVTDDIHPHVADHIVTHTSRVLVRRSGTENVTRIYVEAQTEAECAAVMEQIIAKAHIKIS
jgi:phosphoglucosamine mutase